MEVFSFYTDRVATAWIARRHRTAPLLDNFLYPEVKKLISGIRQGRKLDLGCGDGSSMSVFPDDVDLIGCDCNRRLIEMASQRANLRRATFLQLDLKNALPFERKSFSQIICCQVLMHLSDSAVQMVLQEVERVLSSAGAAVFTNAHPAWVKRRTAGSIDSESDFSCRKHLAADWEGSAVEYYVCGNEWYEQRMREIGFKFQIYHLPFPRKMCNLVPEYNELAGVPLFTIFHLWRAG